MTWRWHDVIVMRVFNDDIIDFGNSVFISRKEGRNTQLNTAKLLSDPSHAENGQGVDGEAQAYNGAMG